MKASALNSVPPPPPIIVRIDLTREEALALAGICDIAYSKTDLHIMCTSLRATGIRTTLLDLRNCITALDIR